jgi:hypothetical protein
MQCNEDEAIDGNEMEMTKMGSRVAHLPGLSTSYSLAVEYIKVDEGDEEINSKLVKLRVGPESCYL